MGLDVRRDPSGRENRAQRAARRLAHSRALPEPVPVQSGRLAQAVRPRPRPGNEQRPAREAAAGGVSDSGGRTRQGDGQAVPGNGNRPGDQKTMTVTTITDAQLTPKDYASDQEVRWCPGCGDYAILKAVQKACAELGVRREQTVFVSGIKLANPELDVWVMTGDGDGLSIGGNHMLHVLRRNVDLNIILFHNEIYGLTKGQYSPTSRRGTRSPSTPFGSVENPVSACAFALGSGARFVARSIDTLQPHLIGVLKRGHAHKGASFVEILQNCVVFNDAVFENITGKDVAADAQILLEHGKPLLFGKQKEKGLRLKPGKLELEIVTLGEGGVTAVDIRVNDEKNRPLAMLLARLEPPFPTAMGVLHCNPTESYEHDVYAQKGAAQGKGDLDALLNSERTWEVVP